MAENTTRVLQTRHGPMMAFRHDRFITRCLEAYGEYSPGEWRVLQQLARPGATVVEAGANIGALTVPLARRCAPGRLLAFEPQQRVFQVLCANLALNQLENVTARPEALGEAIGEAVVPRPDFNRNGNFGDTALRGPDEAGDKVRVVTVDSLDLEDLGLLKIDVEGFEAAVLRGARTTIARCRPVIYSENALPDHQAEVIGLLAKMDYRLHWHLPPLVEGEGMAPAGEDLFGQLLISVNVLAIPAESQRSSSLPVLDPNNWEPPIRKAAGT